MRHEERQKKTKSVIRNERWRWIKKNRRGKKRRRKGEKKKEEAEEKNNRFVTREGS